MSRQNFRKQNGIKLPFAIRKELGLENDKDGVQGKRKFRGSKVADRKEQRRALRVEKRQGKPFAENRRKLQPVNVEDTTSDVENEDSRPPKIEVKQPKKGIFKKTPDSVQAKPPTSILKKTKKRSPSSTETESEHSRASSPGLVLDPNSKSFKQNAEDNDAEIVALERKLGMKGKKKSKLGDDMLEFVLEGLDEENDNKKRKREGQDWLDLKRRKVAADEDEMSITDDLDDSDEETGSDDSGMVSGFDDDNEAISDLDDDHNLEGGLDSLNEDMDDDIETDGFQGFESDDKAESQPQSATKIRENPYVAPVTPGTIPGKYVPPSMRKREASDSNLDMLRRQLQGHLNKLSEANMISILGEIEKLYRTNPRQDVTTVLIDLILTSFAIRSALQNTFIILHAAFLAAVYKVMGTDFGAELLVKLIERFDRESKSTEGGKEVLNLISLLANLFTFNVVSSNIIFDYIRHLLSDFSEASAELLLRVVRDCGPQLRSDDPSALKGIVQMTLDISADMAKKGQEINIRTRVMMDTITDLKNNKIKNATNAAGMTGEHIIRMRKALGTLNSRNLKATEPIRITRDDIANSEKKGKWWLVGASWKGHDANDDSLQQARKELRAVQEVQPINEDEVDLLALAKQYRMNTDVRRSIFVAIMSANDCRDAQTRLLKLRLSTKQEQEISKVILRCARAEPIYNPYYALLAKNLSKDKKKVRIGFQFGLWDFFSRIGEKANEDDSDDETEDGSTIEMHEIVNVAKMYAYLIFHGHLTIGVLKVLNIGFLKEQATMFLEVLLISILTQPKASEEQLIKVFGRAAETPQIIKSLQYFVKKNVRKSDLVSKKDRDSVKEGCRIADIAFKMAGSMEMQPDLE